MSRAGEADVLPRFRTTEQSRAQCFRYWDLMGPDEFRLLKVHAGTRELVCSLEHHNLGAETTPPYRALSYTWDRDKPRYDIRMPGDVVIKVRKNLKDALRSLRDAASDCYVWIDAICINQSSNEERNHQVKLMASIYGNANVVVAWLESDNQVADIAHAFDFIRAAVAYSSDNTSVQQYCAHMKSNPSRNEKRDWKSVVDLCEIRYWSRKWIIQEIITARTIVLHAKGSTLPMFDFEQFLHQVDTSNFESPVAKYCEQISATSAVRIAQQRIQEEHGQAQEDAGLLYKLITRYADNKCHLPCDHVYALVSLAGEQRSHLTISYAASAVEQFRAVMQYVSVHENLPWDQTASFALLLRDLLRVSGDDAAQHRRMLNGTRLLLSAILLDMQILPECDSSLRLRSLLTPLKPIPSFSLVRGQDNADWTLHTNDIDIPYLVGRPDMVYFSITGSNCVGLAACRLETGDQICHLPGTRLVFVARRNASNQSIRIVGRAFVFEIAAMPDDEKKCNQWLRKSRIFTNVPQSQQTVSLGLAKLLELVSYANDLPRLLHSGLELRRMTENAASSCEQHVCARIPSAIAKHWYRRSTKQKLIISGGVCGAVVVALILGITIPLKTGGGGAAVTKLATLTSSSTGDSDDLGCCDCCCCCG